MTACVLLQTLIALTVKLFRITFAIWAAFIGSTFSVGCILSGQIHLTVLNFFNPFFNLVVSEGFNSPDFNNFDMYPMTNQCLKNNS